MKFTDTESVARSTASRGWRLTGAVVVGILVTTSCSDGANRDSATEESSSTVAGVAASGRVLRVPEDHPTIQGAVDAATEGDLVLISPGTYNEEVEVTTDDIVIRGLDRNEVILDGRFEKNNGIRVVGANGVAVENLTAMNYRNNGILWTGATGYRGSYLTAWRNGDYGIYAFDAVGGLIEHSYAAGSTDAGIYIGQCYPCDAVVTDSIAEYNALGYSGTNAGGNLYVVNSVFRNNRMGIVLNSGTYELCYPQRRTTIMGNQVYSNNQADTAAFRWAILFMGSGIFSAGGVENVIAKNRVWDHDAIGVGLVPYVERAPNDVIPDRQYWEDPCSETRNLLPGRPVGELLWDSIESRVLDNVIEDSRVADLVLASTTTDISTLGNCFSGNTFAVAAPRELEALAPCEGESGDGEWTDSVVDMVAWLDRWSSTNRGPDYETAPLPERPILPNMPDAATAPAVPASGVPPTIDEDAIEVPERIE
ncbi:MAG: right-handed parallel beta-helix repeat-containing protein [Actinomycetota bacterium]